METDDVKNWLINQIDSLTPYKNEILNYIIDHADYENIYAEELFDDINLVITPLFDFEFSIHDTSKSGMPYLIVFEDAEGNINRGELLHFVARDSIVDSIPMTELVEFYRSGVCDLNGNIARYSLADRFLGEISLEDGWITQSRFLQEAPHSELGETCTHFYLVTFYYYLGTGEIYDYDVVYLGSSCSGCPPGDPCDILYGGGGGWDEDDQQLGTAEREVLLHDQNSGFPIFKIISKVRAQGWVRNPTTRNEITSIIDDGFSLQPDPGSSGYMYLYNFVITDSHLLINIPNGGATASGTCFAILNSDNPNFQNLPYTEPFSFQATELQ